MKGFITMIILAISALVLAGYCEHNRDPYEQGSHLDYYIECENGFVYKFEGSIISKHAIQIFNSDGTPLRCGEKIY